jgi:hypothetical protein
VAIRRDLKQARDSGELVRLVRRKGWASVEGYVGAVGKRWCVVVSVADGLYDGHAVLRVDDVRRLSAPRSEPLLTQRFLELDGRWPPAAPHVLDLHSARSVAFTAGSLSRLVSLSVEGRAAPVLAVGDIHRITDRRLHYRAITPQGTRGKLRSLRLARLTRIVLWDPYVEKLAQLVEE